MNDLNKFPEDCTSPGDGREGSMYLLRELYIALLDANKVPSIPAHLLDTVRRELVRVGLNKHTNEWEQNYYEVLITMSCNFMSKSDYKAAGVCMFIRDNLAEILMGNYEE